MGFIFQRWSWRISALVAVESILLFFGVLFTAWMRFGFDWQQVVEYGAVPKAVLITLICQMTFYYWDLYVLKGRHNFLLTFLNFLQAIGFAYIVLAIIYYIFPGMIIGRGIGLFSFLFLLLALALWRTTYNRFLTRSDTGERILIIGTGDIAVTLAEEILDDPGCGFRIEGFLTSDSALIGQSIVNPIVLGDINQLDHIVHEKMIDRIVVAMDERRGALPVREILKCKLEGIKVQEGRDLLEQLSGKISVSNLRPSWIIFSEGFHRGKVHRAFKAVLDRLISLAALVVLSPILAIVAAAIRLDSHGPILYRQTRVTQWGREFTVLKFRTMRTDAETNGAQWASENDPRVTWTGRLLRKSRLDELPQLINVLRGEMSLVGPRPERPEFITQLREVIPYYDERHSVKPGVTGWAQVRFSYGNTIEDSMEKLQYDLYYIKHMSPVLDLFILLQTIKIVLLGRGAM